MTSPTIYRSAESVLNALNAHKADNIEAVNTLIEVYNNALNAFMEDEKQNPVTNRHPLVVLEGLDGCGKSTVSKKLASKLQAERWCTPPESIKNIRHLFDEHAVLRTAYYALGNYIAALECSILLKKQPVIMDRYWHSTSAYAIAQAVNDFPGEVEIPPEGDTFYHWPNDLLKPNLVLFLDVNEDNRIQRLSRRTEITLQENLLRNSQQFRDNIILAYKNMVSPQAIFVDSNLKMNKVIAAINDKLQDVLK
ncbi:hypothetical protein Zmor_013959 [Zophobas morio]|uniref:Thymidylate kinase-like domain-containing protein n=2 Tax=Zophobas morio TaxID=2755281 RepID=A0AA38IG78_9CUCU|nr:hypothetical protein Zmor_013959 [Zophobas morio]